MTEQAADAGVAEARVRGSGGGGAAGERAVVGRQPPRGAQPARRRRLKPCAPPSLRRPPSVGGRESRARESRRFVVLTHFISENMGISDVVAARRDESRSGRITSF